MWTKALKTPSLTYMQIMEKTLSFKDAPFSLRDDYEFAKTVISSNPLAIAGVSPRLSKYKPLAFLAVSLNGFALEHLNDMFKDDLEIVKAAILKYPLAIRYASARISNLKEIGLDVVRRHGNALLYLSDELRDDEEIVLTSIKHFAPSLTFCSARLHNDLNFSVKAMQANPFAFLHLQPHVKDNMAFQLRVHQVPLTLDRIYLISKDKRAKRV